MRRSTCLTNRNGERRPQSLANEGLQPLADLLMLQENLPKSKQVTLQAYVDSANDVPDPDTALAGALDIVAEQWSEDAESRTWLAVQAKQFGKVVSKVKRGKKSAEGADKFELYFDRQESASRIPGHRLLAMLRGSAEGILNVGVHIEGTRELSELKRRLLHNRQFEFHAELLGCVEDCYERLLMPATESTILQSLKEKADTEAISVFGKNLQELLMSPPAGPRSHHRDRSRFSNWLQSRRRRWHRKVPGK